MLTPTQPVMTLERGLLAVELQELSGIFANVLSKFYPLSPELGGGIELLDAFLTEIIETHDALCAPEVGAGELERYELMLEAVTTLDRALNARMSYRRRFLYFRHIISRYTRSPAPPGSSQESWRKEYIEKLEADIDELRREYEARDDVRSAPYPFRL